MAVSYGIILADNEEIISVARTHWTTAVGAFAVAIVLTLVSFFFLWPLFQLQTIGVIIFAAMIIIAVLTYLWAYRRWHETMLILTTVRIVWVRQQSFFDRAVTEAFYQNISDISHRLKGFWPTMLNYGTLIMRVSGASEPLEITTITRPAEIHHLIIERREQALAKNTEPNDSEWWEDRLLGMNQEERRRFYFKVRERLGEYFWRDFFRPESGGGAGRQVLPDDNH